MPPSFATPLDGVRSTLAAPYAAGGTSIAVESGAGPAFGMPTAAAPVRVTLVADLARLGDMAFTAYYLATGRAGDTLTGVTFDGGTDQAFPVGSSVLVLVNAATIAEIHAALLTTAATAATLSATSDGGTAYTIFADTPIDGGSPSTSFSAAQVIDGGSPSATYGGSTAIDGGTP